MVQPVIQSNKDLCKAESKTLLQCLVRAGTDVFETIKIYFVFHPLKMENGRH